MNRFGTFSPYCCGLAALILCPLLPGIVNKVKAFFAGRQGVRLFQLYFDLWKLMKKERVHSSSAAWILPLAPLGSLAALMTALWFLPLGLTGSPLGFPGDVVAFFYLLAGSRFLMVLAALETGSSFEGMGASREMQFSALAEGSVFALLAMLAMLSESLELSVMLRRVGISLQSRLVSAGTISAALAFFIVLLCENCRVPFDDPETHLELTMIHEAMILDYGGPDLAAILYGAALKMWLYSAFLTAMILPAEWFDTGWGLAGWFAGTAAVAVLIGIVESVMARSRFLKLPQLLSGAAVLILTAVFIQLFFPGGSR